MTVIVTDPQLSSTVSDGIQAALLKFQNDPAISALIESQSGAQSLVVVDRLPASASILDPDTGVRTIVTDPAQIAAMLQGTHAFVGAASNSPQGSAAILFDWSNIDLGDGATPEGQAVLFIGSDLSQSATGYVAVEGQWGMTTETGMDRALLDGLARSFSDSVGGMDSDLLSMDHGTSLSSLLDATFLTIRLNDDYDHFLFDLQGPQGFTNWGGTQASSLLMNATSMSFDAMQGGGYGISGSGGGDGILDAYTFDREFHAVGHEVLGQKYERYNLSEMVSSEKVFSHSVSETFSTAANGSMFLGDIVAPVFEQRMLLASIGIRTIDLGLQSDRESAQGDMSTEDLGFNLGLWGFADGLEFGHKRMIGFSAEREVNMTADGLAHGVQTIDANHVYDASGPTAYGTTDSAPVLAIDDSAATANTVILGAGGADPGVTGWTNTLGSVDWIQAGSGSDIILVGDGVSSDGVLRNLVHGNGGHDVIVGGIGGDDLYGDAGNDLFFVSDGIDFVDGGTGFDVLNANYAGGYDGFTGIVYDGATGILTTERGTTTAVNIERVMGSEYNDVIIGAEGMVLDGNNGDDVLHVAANSIASGGAGADEYHVAPVAFGDSKILLLGFDQDDSLWLDGIRHGGNNAAAPDGWNTEASNPDDYWSDQFFAAPDETQDGLSMIRIQHHVAGAVVGTTDIMISGYTPGEGGLQYDQHQAMPYDVADVTGMFMGAGYVPQVEMFGLV